MCSLGRRVARQHSCHPKTDEHQIPKVLVLVFWILSLKSNITTQHPG